MPVTRLEAMKNDAATMEVSALAAMPYFMFAPAWVEQSSAFQHEDPRLAKAYIKLLIAAWRGCPAGSVPSSHSYIADATALPLEIVGEHYVTLTDGFQL